MDTERLLRQRADLLGITIRDLIVNLIESAFPPDYPFQWGPPTGERFG
jgi:hypothetical protein